MTDAELRDELMTLLVAGHETTATALAWAFERLVRHPAALARLREEADAGDDTYLDAVVKETLRSRPVVIDVARTLAAPARVGGYDLPAGRDGRPDDHARPDRARSTARTRTRSVPSASSTARSPTRTPGSPSAAACAAASARASPASR